MPDSEEECDTWRNRDKYPKEREEVKRVGSQSPNEIKSEPSDRNEFNRNEKRSFDNFQFNKCIEPPFKRQRRETAEDGCNFNKHNNFRDNKDARREPSYDNRYNSNISKTADETVGYPTQPQMLLFKHFLQQQNDDIEMDEAMKKYNEYKENFITKQLKTFFQTYSSHEWFREKYLPSFVAKRKVNVEKSISLRRDIFMYLLDSNWLENVKVHVDETDSIVRLMDAVVILLEGGNAHDLTILFTQRYRSESPNDSRNDEMKDDSSIKTSDKLSTACIDSETKGLIDQQLNENQSNESNEKSVDNVNESIETNQSKFNRKPTGNQEPRALHKTYSIFLRNLHPNVLRSEIEALVQPYPGFLRLALQDPTPDRKFFRRGWVTYDRTVNIKKICWDLNNVRLKDCDIGAIVNRELTQRVRPVTSLTNHKSVMRNDVRIASKLVAKFDKRHNLWQKEDENDPKNPFSSNNPLLADITEFLVDEANCEEEELLSGNTVSNPMVSITTDSSGTNDSVAQVKIDVDVDLATILDRMIFYLRFVHSFDFYSTTEYQIEDEMPHRCGIIHARGAHGAEKQSLSERDLDEYMRTFSTKADTILNGVDMLCVDDESIKLGYRNMDEAVESFLAENTQEIAKDKWLCPLSGKKFKGPDFVHKHILNKHMDKVELAKQNAEFFNNYLLDPKRPQLPEHPVNRVVGSTRSIETGEIGRDQSALGDNGRYRDNVGGNFDSRSNRDNSRNRRNDEFDSRRSSYRGSSPGGPIGGSGFRDYGGSRNSLGSGGDARGGMGNNNGGNYYRKSGNYQSRGGNQAMRNQRNSSGSYYARKLLSYNDLDAPIDD